MGVAPGWNGVAATDAPRYPPVNCTGDEGRPMLARSDVAEVFTARQTSYSSAATLTIDTGGRSPEDITADILTRLAGD